ncbi:MAG TPA: hypothetical protein PLH27_14310 [bacterium]|nr:hypothetical protein [bacterium]HMW34100.1 hypothetical protein [bacterium]HMW35542.1 hypothetical protein [bacterium]HMY35195.1 hypothetical protein [bacterium]HMZ03677.1 hypothetical protein [bacterium]
MTMRTSNMLRFVPTLVTVLLIVGYRLMPHPWNFVPVTAMAIFGGIYLNRSLAYGLPLASMIVADLFLGMDWTSPVVYASILVSSWIGTRVRNVYENKKQFAVAVGGGTLASSVLFYLTTNFAAWLVIPEYTKDISGLIQSYIMAIPFFKNALAGDMFFIVVFVGVYEAIHFIVTKLSRQSAPIHG